MSDALDRHDLADAPRACPVCGQAGQRYRFQANRVTPGCANPHHGRPRRRKDT